MFDTSKDVSTDQKGKHFLVRYEQLEETIKEFTSMLDKENSLQYEIDPEFEPNYAALGALDDMGCCIRF